MAGSVNKSILIGNLGADPKRTMMQSGKPVVSFNLATGESWKDKSTGEKRERTDWHRVVIFNEGLCKIAHDYLKKGSKVYIEGQMQTRKWEKDGVTHYTTEVVLQSFSASLTLLGGSTGQTYPDGYNQEPAPATGDTQATNTDRLDDEVVY